MPVRHVMNVAMHLPCTQQGSVNSRSQFGTVQPSVAVQDVHSQPFDNSKTRRHLACTRSADTLCLWQAPVLTRPPGNKRRAIAMGQNAARSSVALEMLDCSILARATVHPLPPGCSGSTAAKTSADLLLAL